MTTVSRILLLLLAAFFSLGDAAAEDEALRLWHAYRGKEAVALTQAAEAYTAQTGVRIQLTATPFGAFEKKLETAIPRGNGPDLFIAAHGNLGKWQDLDLMQAVEPESPQHALALEALSDKKQLWGHPLALKTLLLFSDPTLVDQVSRMSCIAIAYIYIYIYIYIYM